jgi:hypothetical protein
VFFHWISSSVKNIQAHSGLSRYLFGNAKKGGECDIFLTGFHPALKHSSPFGLGKYLSYIFRFIVSLDPPRRTRFTQGASKKLVERSREKLAEASRDALDSLKGYRKSWSSGAEKSLLKLVEMHSIH